MSTILLLKNFKNYQKNNDMLIENTFPKDSDNVKVMYQQTSTSL